MKRLVFHSVPEKLHPVTMDDSVIICDDDNDLQIIEEEFPEVRNRASALDRVERRVRHRLEEEQEKIEILHTKRDVERAHSQFLQQNVSDRDDLREAQAVAQGWTRQNARRNIPDVRMDTPPRTAALDRGAVELTCSVINCGMTFTNADEKQAHVRAFSHSPCNPFLLTPDGTISHETKYFCCPHCQSISKDYNSCLDHMIAKSHLDLGEPLEIRGFACPSCLSIFPDKQTCHNHMQKNRHLTYMFPFPADLTVDGAKPTPFPAKLLRDFIQRCSTVAWSLECMSCGQQMLTTEDYLIHRQKTQCMKMTMAIADSNLGDVFRHFVKSCACSECHRLLDMPENASFSSVIMCGDKEKALLIQNDCQTFAEMVCRYALPDLPHTVVPDANDGSDTQGLQVAGGHPESNSSEKTSNINRNQRTIDDKQREVMQHVDQALQAKELTHRPEVNPQHSVESDANRTNAKCAESLVDSSIHNMIQERRIIKITRVNNEKDSTAVSKPIIKVAPVQFPDKKEGGTKRCREDKSEHSERLTEPATKIQRACEHDRTSAMDTSQTVDKLAALNLTEGKTELKAPKQDPKSRPYTYPSQSVIQHPSLLGTPQFRWIDPSLLPLGTFRFSAPVVTHSYIQQQRNHNNYGNQRGNYYRYNQYQRHGRWNRPRPPHRENHANVADVTSLNTSVKEPENLDQMRHILFLDLDNWINFFGRLPGRLPDRTFIWAFYGGKTAWYEPRKDCYRYQKENGWFHLHGKCGTTKDAADFALALTVGRMDERLPKSIPFTVLSGDRGFCELERQMKNSERRAVVINPHNETEDMVYTLITSVADS